MDAKEFIEKLNKVRNLMNQEKYIDALEILDILKNIEKTNEESLNSELTHQLYQLDSNCRSEFQQHLILTHLNKMMGKKASISFKDLNQKLSDKGILNLSSEVLRREVELLILRNRLQCRIDKETLIM